MDKAASALSRRNILLGAAGAAIATMVAVPRFLPGAEERTRRLLAGNRFTRRFLSLADAEQDEWAAQVGTVFTAEGGLRMRLAGVRPLASQGRRPASISRNRGFLAVFDLLDGRSIPGDLIYSVSHGQYGRLPIFLSASDNPRRMLAVFN